MGLLRRIENIEPFRVMQLLERARQLEASGRKIIHLEIGEPDFCTPPSVIAAAHQALDAGELGYTPSTGLPALQQALALWYASEYGVTVAPERILITPGTSGAFSLIYDVLLEAGESVLLPDPGYPCQRNFIRLADGEPISLPVGPASGYHLDAALLADNWRDNTRAAVLISPSNPTGTVAGREQMQGLLDCCRQRGGYLISDEIYHGLNYDGQAISALELDDRAIVVNGFSKRWAMTGWRIGWVVVPSELIDPCRRVMQNIFIAAPTLSQQAAVAALRCTDEIEQMRQAYDQRRRYLLSALPPLGFKIAVEPTGAFYIYADVSDLTDDAVALCAGLLEEAGVAITPGEDFGNYRAATHVRFSYATSMADLELGIARIGCWLAKRR